LVVLYTNVFRIGETSLKISITSFYDENKKEDNILSYLFTSSRKDNPFFSRPVFEANALNLGSKNSILDIYHHANVPYQVEKGAMDHEDAIDEIIEVLQASKLLKTIVVVGHRVAHGGNRFSSPAIINDTVVDDIKRISHTGRKENPANILGIRLVTKKFPNLPALAVFDTSYHSTMPPKAFTYALPESFRNDLQIRKYGSSGMALDFITGVAKSVLQNKMRQPTGFTKNSVGTSFIVVRLGNEPSATAVVNGKSADTSVGFLSNEGVSSGTAIGSIDPAIISYIAKSKKIPIEEVLQTIEQQSGLRAISGGETDIDILIKNANGGDENAALAVDIYVYNISKHVASMLVACGGVTHGLIFTEGSRENNHEIREKVMEYLSPALRVNLCRRRNKQAGRNSQGIISVKGKATNTLLMVIPADDKIVISLECKKKLPHLFMEERRGPLFRSIFMG